MQEAIKKVENNLSTFELSNYFFEYFDEAYPEVAWSCLVQLENVDEELVESDDEDEDDPSKYCFTYQSKDVELIRFKIGRKIINLFALRSSAQQSRSKTYSPSLFAVARINQICSCNLKSARQKNKI